MSDLRRLSRIEARIQKTRVLVESQHLHSDHCPLGNWPLLLDVGFEVHDCQAGGPKVPSVGICGSRPGQKTIRDASSESDLLPLGKFYAKTRSKE